MIALRIEIKFHPKDRKIDKNIFLGEDLTLTFTKHQLSN